MQNVVIFAPTSATRKLYHHTLSKREYQTYRVADLAELLLVLVSFEIDTIILVDEGKNLHEIDLAVDIISRKFDKKRLIIISATHPGVPSAEVHGSSRDFLDNIL